MIGGNFFFQAEDGIRDAQESRGLGDVYKRQVSWISFGLHGEQIVKLAMQPHRDVLIFYLPAQQLSLIHI